MVKRIQRIKTNQMIKANEIKKHNETNNKNRFADFLLTKDRAVLVMSTWGIY